MKRAQSMGQTVDSRTAKLRRSMVVCLSCRNTGKVARLRKRDGALVEKPCPDCTRRRT